VVERALADNNRETTLILAKALKFGWETTMSLLFPGARNHRISARDLDGMREEFAPLNTETCRNILGFYRSRKHAPASRSGLKIHQLSPAPGL
jgi:hypothetical protein